MLQHVRQNGTATVYKFTETFCAQPPKKIVLSATKTSISMKVISAPPNNRMKTWRRYHVKWCAIRKIYFIASKNQSKKWILVCQNQISQYLLQHMNGAAQGLHLNLWGGCQKLHFIRTVLEETIYSYAFQNDLLTNFSLQDEALSCRRKLLVLRDCNFIWQTAVCRTAHISN